ncbi:CRISPR-associated endonuclease Cas4g/Cas1g [Tuwongella immobilis]|uniref:CRISPR-associated endonuclease Cas1 n=1 Tax=Tuwongella immobilis TaxID=692036 RepID=A0A6C2YK01_9BACT|nr:CRISPR-associated endonuclease Cas1 [Tuwongella immobilis]VIP01704.1 crispr-associated protein cas4 : CRISPR-associated endonuclease Cas1 OS=Planctomyces limnophilus (strain ATCC 43296 / DSM 3776 / IFAM 1008 / 290) GN=cas1 PE=3 SV=1: Cas_Cas4: Cas_Cas1 [Tuwongella immobilis]VTR99200.1 crispr-associated protein cas4 : CRISPR-associated endonuclease Cas1 OS=Planctomyces limnophilus (strain ATCC 43296 / DSM 3776 / IFAM 1008 / 290) GN=cas1 PE=3 SV=1: Cas_Cas4: Cas_Cas1 [Tuwongella immobilis]
MLEIRSGEIVPARMLNEFAYCPRLAYLEWIQGEWHESEDTVDGAFVHRNVDAPQKSAIPVPTQSPAHESPPAEAESLHARSVRLENAELGLVAVVDVLECDGPIATPVDYKKSATPNREDGAWDPERVQLCAQGLLLQAAGYQCTEGILWYDGSRERVTIPFTDELIAFTKQLLTDCRAMARSGVMPLPLVDSPKCPRCSLVSICLPDETNFLRSQAASGSTESGSESAPELPLGASLGTPLGVPTGGTSVGTSGAALGAAKPVRLLMPPRPEKVPLHVVEPGAKLGKRAERLVIELDSQKIGEAKLKDLAAVCLYGPVQVSTQLMHELLSREVPICYFSTGGWFQGVASGLPHKNIELRIRQHAIAADPVQALRLARRFVSGKIRNCRTLLRRNTSQPMDRLLAACQEAADQAERATSLDSLLGIEGMAAKRYFEGFATLLSETRGFQLDGRNRRPPTDPVNAVLSYGYSLLAREMTSAIMASGLDPYLGFLHQPRYGRPALALDLCEEFRPILVDSVVLSLINTGELKPEHFVSRAGSVALKPNGKRAVLAAWERRLNSEVTHPIFGYSISYRRILMVQARLVARVLTGEFPEYPAFKTR